MKRVLLMLASCSWLCMPRAVAGPDYDELLYRALRHGDTAERRAEKAAARAELDALGAEALRAMMARAHFENLMLHVVALEFVQNQVPAETGAPILVEALDSPHEQTRRAAAFLLGFYPRRGEAIPALLAMLDREKERNAALRTLGVWRVQEARAPAGALLRADEERTRIAACNALNRIGHRDDIPALIEALGDEAILVRNAAARALTAHGPAALRALRAALPRAQGAQQRQLIRLLGELRDKEARRTLARLRNHPDPDVRADAEWALAQVRAGEPPPSRAAREPLF